MRSTTATFLTVVIVLFGLNALEGSAKVPIPSKFPVSDSSLRSRRQTDNDGKPDLNLTRVSETLESKLANMRLGNAVRSRRDELHARKDIENAEIKSAVAAVEAEEAKESALAAVVEDGKAEKDLDDLHKKLNTVKNIQLLPSKVKTNPSTSVGGSKVTGIVKDLDGYEADDGGDDDDDDAGKEDEAEETIVEDDVVTIKTTLVEDGHGKKDPKDGSGGTAVCKGLLDLKSMSDDFRQRLQSLIDREEQVVERLEQLENDFSETLQSTTSVMQQMQRQSSSDKNGNVQPSKACVYIQETIETGTSAGTGAHQQSKLGPANLNQNQEEGKIHVYTSEGVFPNPNSPQAQPLKSNQQQHQFSNQLPIIQGHLKSPGVHNSANFNQDFNNGDSSRLKVMKNRKFKRVSKSAGGNGDEEPEIDLENIYWLKTDADGPSSASSQKVNANGNGSPNNPLLDKKFQSVINEIQEDNLDLLIIPISSKFDKVEDVAKSLWSAMRDRKQRLEKDAVGKRKRFRMTVRRIK